jgi:hypothetical protein
MITLLTLEMINSSRSSEGINDRTGKNNVRSEIIYNLKEERKSSEIEESVENFIILLPLLILTAGIIVMYVLDKIFLK